MKYRVLFLLTLLLMYVLIPIQNATASLDNITLSAVGDSEKTSLSTDTTDITFTLRVSNSGRSALTLIPMYETSPYIPGVLISDGGGANVPASGSKDFTYTLPRGLIANAGTYMLKAKVAIPPATTTTKSYTFTLTVNTPGTDPDDSTSGSNTAQSPHVELSQFSAKFVKDEVVINWTTESELDNAGFNIFRSTSRTKNFHRINPKLIKGAGTTGQRTQYQFIDKTAKPDVAYYYRLEDIDLSGKRGVSTTYRLRGVIAPTGKHLTTWGTLKDNR